MLQHKNGTLAQLVEQRTFNPFVVGSTPAGPTKFKPRRLYVYGVFCYPKSSVENQKIIKFGIFARILPEFRGMKLSRYYSEIWVN